MADISDVENGLVALIAQTLYPNGTGNPVSPVCNAQARVYRGWPNAATLDVDLEAGRLHVTVHSPGVSKNTTRYPRDWEVLSPAPAATLTATVAGDQVTIGGTVATPQNVAVLANGQVVIYGVQPADTLVSIATGLAALLAPLFPGAASAGAVVTVPGAIAGKLIARVGTVGTVARELRRTMERVQITFWCPTPALRDAAVPPVDAALSTPSFIALADGTKARLRYVTQKSDDAPQKALLYRRDLFYETEYALIATQAAAQILTLTKNLTGGVDPTAPAIATLNQ